ncbi:UDP-glucuronic acid decarboxylase 2-like protein, partial [Tanacetum coccineum]
MGSDSPTHRRYDRYILREQRLLFVLIGIAIATAVFTVIPTTTTVGPTTNAYSISESVQLMNTNNNYKRSFNSFPNGFESINLGGKIPLGLKRKGLRIVVTGGAGFVGSHLVDRLMARGDSVIVVDNFFTGNKDNVQHHFGNPRFELIRHDVVEPLLLEVDQIYHLACPASPTNVVGTLNMLGLAKRVGARFLLTSTSEVYGDPLQHPQVRNSYWGNVNPIGCLWRKVRIARIFNTYGPRMCIDDGRVVSNFVAQALRKEPLTVYGDGKQTRSFQFVSDLMCSNLSWRRNYVGHNKYSGEACVAGSLRMLTHEEEFCSTVKAFVKPRGKTQISIKVESIRYEKSAYGVKAVKNRKLMVLKLLRI